MRNKVPFIVLGLLLVFIILVQLNAPKKLDWTPSYSKGKTIPLGGKIMFDELDQIFPDAEVTESRETVYNTLQDSTIENTNYLFITTSLNFSETENTQLFDFVERGNNVFISSSYYSPNYKRNIDTIRFEDYYRDELRISMYNQGYGNYEDSIRFTLDHINQHSDTISLENKFLSGQVFCDSIHFTRLSSTFLEDSDPDQNMMNFVRMQHGEGSFFFHSNPALFSNYHLMTEEGRTYAASILSHIPEGDVIWDQYYKPDFEGPANRSNLRGLAQSKSLRWMMFSFIICGLLFLFFRGKREQRVIPIVEPPKNLSLTFVKTVGELYYERQDHTDLVHKQVKFFKDYLNQQYRIRKLENTEASRKHFLQKTEVDISFGNKLLNKIFIGEKMTMASHGFLNELTKMIEQFKRQ